MNLFIALLLLIILSVLEDTLIPLNLVLAFVIIISLRSKSLLGLAGAFMGGILIDIFSGYVVGLSSFLMLLISGILIYLKEKFSLKNPILRFTMVFLLYLIYQVLMVGTWQFKEAAVMAIVMTLMTQDKEEAVRL